MELVRIFGGDNPEEQGGLYAVRYTDDSPDVFQAAFRFWSNPLEILAFLEKQRRDWQSPYLRRYGLTDASSIADLVFDQAERFEEALLRAEEEGRLPKAQANLQSAIFEPLEPSRTRVGANELEKWKAKPKGRPPRLLRLYALRLAPNLFIVTGYAIKLTEQMDRPHLQAELRKLERVKNWLIEEGLTSPEAISEIEL